MGVDVPCTCGCTQQEHAAVHAIANLLASDDLDAAIDAGLLACDGCPDCSADCTQSLLAARDARRFALASRERYRAREARLARRKQERLARRMPTQHLSDDAPAMPTALSAAAAAALARAKERAAGRGPRG
jgi:hypothetical protein